MTYKIDNPKSKQKANANYKNPYYVDGKDMSKTPIYYLEGDYGLTKKQEIALWQYGVDTGQVWHLQGWYGRNAQAMLDAGVLKYPKKRQYDYYGNPIPTSKEKPRHTAWNVSLNRKRIDTVFFNPDIKKEDVKRSLVEHDGYDPDIKLNKSRTLK